MTLHPVRTLAQPLLRPSLALLLLALLGLAFHLAALAWLGVAALAAIVALPLGQWLARPLENAHPRPSAAGRIDGIVVLGGAVEQDIFADRGTTALNAAAERMTEFLALARLHPGARLVFAGGFGRIGVNVSEADEARALFAALGLPPERVIFEGASRDTWQNATLAHPLAQPAPEEVWLLVTSALHMPRALGAFHAAGWPARPWPVGYKTLRHRARWIEAPATRIALFEAALHEWAGLLAYRAAGHWRPMAGGTRRCIP